MKYTLTIREEHYVELRRLLIKSDGNERAAIMLCGRGFIKNDAWDGGPEERFLSKMILHLQDDEIISQSKAHVQWRTETFRKSLKIAESQDLAICLVHNHPIGELTFSDIDNANEPSLITTIYNRNGGKRPHLSIFITPDDRIIGRAWSMNIHPYNLSLIRVLGSRFTFHYDGKYNNISRDTFHRQQLALGRALNSDLEKLRIGVVGCGATGTSTAFLLSRIGVGHILLIDNDVVERSNLSRMHGATAADADAGRPKVDVLRDYLTHAGIGTRVRVINKWAGDEGCRDPLKSCDIIFGCTDDNSGRMFLNRFSHFYLIPVFDMGIIIELSKDKPLRIIALQGRMTLLFPGNTCLLCRGEVNSKAAAEENTLRSDPMGFERLKDERYVVGSGDPSPSVVTFTTEISTVAVNEFINRITGFKQIGTQNNIMRFFNRGEDGNPGAKRRDGCPICDDTAYWGIGDVTPFLDQTN
jgi:molybdopterin/thiamine biosynthesis adenylyltransferase